MTWEQALAVRGPVMVPSTPPAKSPSTAPFGLTGREVEVLRLLAQGLTAEQLVISPRTVTSRSAATRYALDQHLI